MEKIRVLAADKLAQEGLAMLQADEQVEVDVKTGLKEDELAAIVGQYDGLIVRSGAKVTAKVLANPGRLKAIARAGVGVDNVNVPVATAAGILVMNTPEGNTLSTAELTLALMLSMLRQIPAATASLKRGEWERSKYTGRQVAGKTLGVLGLGRVGTAVAARALAMKMTVIGYDPFKTGGAPLEGRVRLAESLEEMLKEADILTVHTPLTDQTRGIIGQKEIAMMKDGAYVINCARGGIINEEALYEALQSGKLAGAAMDVYEPEPPKAEKDVKLIGLDKAVCTPHLGASTHEAQKEVSVEAAKILLDYLKRGEIHSAVNVAGLPASLSPRDRSYIDLAERMGALISPLCSDGVEEVTVSTQGAGATEMGPMLGRYLLVGLLQPFFDIRLNLINIPDIAQERGIVMRTLATRSGPEDQDKVTLIVRTPSGQHEIEGSVAHDGQPRILGIDGYRMDMVPAGSMLLIQNDDQPGVIGLVGTTLGQQQVNIADMTLSRHQKKALMVLKIDEPAPPSAIGALMKHSPPIRLVKAVNLEAARTA
jgi:D-3-phosphoglycerate dehydrogenase